MQIGVAELPKVPGLLDRAILTLEGNHKFLLEGDVLIKDVETMSEPETTLSPHTYPETQQNWQLKLQNQTHAFIVKAKLYTDAIIIGQTEAFGPYKFLNTLAHASFTRGANLTPAIVLRAEIFPLDEQQQRRRFSHIKADYDHYHGGDHIDEIAALASLVMGIRLKAGPVDREFVPGNDPLGKPIQYNDKSIPYLSPAIRGQQIPRLSDQHNLCQIFHIEKLPIVSAENANAAIKAARLYQEAMWIAEADPALAWLLLVSAVEAAAGQWKNAVEPSRVSVQRSLPKIVDLLNEHDCVHLMDPLSDILSVYVGSTNKFINFLLDFMPSPPEVRPHEAEQFQFTKQKVKAAANKIYNYRSKALHGGTAFPFPMCQPPRPSTFSEVQNGSFQEIPYGLATHALNASWTIKDTPMLLHTFEHLARGALVNWWKQL